MSRDEAIELLIDIWTITDDMPIPSSSPLNPAPYTWSQFDEFQRSRAIDLLNRTPGYLEALIDLASDLPDLSSRGNEIAEKWDMIAFTQATVQTNLKHTLEFAYSIDPDAALRCLRAAIRNAPRTSIIIESIAYWFDPHVVSLFSEIMSVLELLDRAGRKNVAVIAATVSAFLPTADLPRFFTDLRDHHPDIFASASMQSARFSQIADSLGNY